MIAGDISWYILAIAGFQLSGFISLHIALRPPEGASHLLAFSKWLAPSGGGGGWLVGGLDGWMAG